MVQRIISFILAIVLFLPTSIADLGIMFNSDGSEIAVVDSTGKVVPRNEIFHVDEDAFAQAIRKIAAVGK